jgi:hypothetical protein
MLVKWAIEGRRKTAKTKPSTNDNDRQERATTPSKKAPSAKNRPQIAGSSAETETTAQALTARLDRLHYKNDTALARSSESDGDRAMRRIDAMERDTMLRDDKLLSLTGPDLLRHNSSQEREAQPSMPLTEENIEKFVHAQDGDSKTLRVRSSDQASNEVNQPHSTIDSRVGKVRPSLAEARLRESEQTVTKEALK